METAALYPFLVASRGWAAVRVPAVQVAAMPLVVVVLRRLAGEPVPLATALGVVAGFAGVAVLVLPGNRTPGAGALGLGIILVATVSMAVASFVSRAGPETVP